MGKKIVRERVGRTGQKKEKKDAQKKGGIKPENIKMVTVTIEVWKLTSTEFKGNQWKCIFPRYFLRLQAFNSAQPDDSGNGIQINFAKLQDSNCNDSFRKSILKSARLPVL